VALPAGVKVKHATEAGRVVVSVEGPKGKLSVPLRPDIAISVDSSAIRVTRKGDTAFERAYHGTARALLANMVRGVSEGFARSLEIEGVGYSAKLEKKNLVLSIGFCHPVTLPIPDGLTLETPKPTQINVKGADRIRRVRPPEPYKGKGIRYTGEKIIRKAGKAFGSGE
jgi:large subunit ribosomal protein L6